MSLNKRKDSLFVVKRAEKLGDRFCRLNLELKDKNEEFLPIKAGQFCQVRVPKTHNSYLRLPISIMAHDPGSRSLELLIQIVGEGSQYIASRQEGEDLQILYPLGNGFSQPQDEDNVLLLAGGVGVAPLYGLLDSLCKNGERKGKTTFLYGARGASDLLLRQDLESKKGINVLYSTQNASMGEKGLVTEHSIFAVVSSAAGCAENSTAGCAENSFPYNKIYVCGPEPMMKAVFSLVKNDLEPSLGKKIELELSLENKMACGIGACLCCVAQDKDGHNRCVCTEGPVFNSNILNW